METIKIARPNHNTTIAPAAVRDPTLTRPTTAISGTIATQKRVFNKRYSRPSNEISTIF